MTLYGSDAIAFAAVFEQVASEYDILHCAAKHGNDLRVANLDLKNFPVNPDPLYHHFERILQRFGSLPKMRHSWLEDRDDFSVKYAPMDEGLEMFLYFRRFKTITKKFSTMFMDSASEMTKSGTLENLKLSINEMMVDVLKFSKMVETEHQLKSKLDLLQSKLKNIQKETEDFINHRKEIIAYLRDQLQEFKSQASMETKYIQKSSNETILQVKQKCSMKEKEFSGNISSIFTDIQADKRITAEIVSWLTHKNADLQIKINYANERQHVDVQNKQNELEELRDKQEKGREALKKLVVQYDFVEQTVMEHRALRAELENKAKRDENENLAAIKLQNWWRALLVMKSIKIKKKPRKSVKAGKKVKKKAKM